MDTTALTTATNEHRLHFMGFPITAFILNKQAWMLASDVAEALGASSVGQVTRSLTEDVKGVHVVHTLGGPQTVAILNQEGVIWAALKARPKDPARAKRVVAFQRWAVRALDQLLSGEAVTSPNGQPLQQSVTIDQIKAAVREVLEERAEQKRAARKALPRPPRPPRQPLDITPEVLAAIAADPGASGNEIMRCVHHQRSFVYRTIQKLHADGVIEMVRPARPRSGWRVAEPPQNAPQLALC